MRKIPLLLVFFSIILTNYSNAQVGVGTTTPDTSAQLDVTASDKGVLVPRIALTDVNTTAPITSPAQGLLIWNTNASITDGQGIGFYMWNGSAWEKIITQSGSSRTTLDDAYDEGGAGVGKNITADTGAVRIDGDDGFLVTGTFGTGNPIDSEITGAGTRMFFNPFKGAFRAGEASGTEMDNTNIGAYSTAFGLGNISSGNESMSWGNLNLAQAEASTAFGTQTAAGANSATAFGYQTLASGIRSTAFGESTEASGNASVALGYETTASGDESLATGAYTTASGLLSIAFGLQSQANGQYSLVGGNMSLAGGDYSMAFGNTAIATGANSFAMGSSVTASQNYDIALGQNTTASGSYSFSGGIQSTSSGLISFSYGQNLSANGEGSTAFGKQNSSDGAFSFTTGEQSGAGGKYSFASGYYSHAPSFAETTIGTFPTTYTPASGTTFDATDRIFTIGNGVDSANKSNALVIYKDGRMTINDAYTMPTTDGTANQLLLTDGTGNLSWADGTSLGLGDHDWYKESTTDAPDDITNDIFTMGNVAIGKNSAYSPLDIDLTNHSVGISVADETGADPTSGTREGIRIEIGNLGDTGTQIGTSNKVGIFISTPSLTERYGVYNIVGNSTDNSYGIYNSLYNSFSGGGNQFGTYNDVLYNSSDNGSSHYGTYNKLDAIGGGDVDTYGTRSVLGNDGIGSSFGAYNELTGMSVGDKYGVYNKMVGLTGGGSTKHYGVYTELSDIGGDVDQLGIYTSISGGSSGTGKKYGIHNKITCTGDGEQYGARNELSGTATGIQYGSYQTISVSGDGAHYGVRNQLSGTGSGDHYGSFNDLSGTGTGYQYGVRNDISNSGDFPHYGVRNNLSGGGSGNHYGVNNYLTGAGAGTQYGTYQYITNSGNSIHYGVYTQLAGTGTGNKFGNYNYIQSSAGGTHFGTYNNVSESKGWAGYFVGKTYFSNKIGINNPTPDGYLDIKANSTGSIGHIELTETGTNDGSRIMFQNSVETDNKWTLWGKADNTSSDSYFNIHHTTNGNLITVRGNGNVGIGDDTPDYKLDVNGDINTEGELRKSGGAYFYPDYVFERYYDDYSKYNATYSLKTLEEIEAYIKNNKHLPDVQSRADIQMNGWNVTEGVKDNLEKIEELYVHSIELEKENKAQKQEINDLKQRLEKIEKLLKE